MSVKAIAAKVRERLLKDMRLDIDFKVREGGWINPSYIEFEHDGKPQALCFFDGQTPSQSGITVEQRIYEDVLSVVTSSPARR